MNNTLSPKGECLTQGCGHYWQSFPSVFLFAPLSLSLSRVSVAVCVSVYPTVSVYQSWFHREKGAHFQFSSRKGGRNEVTVEEKTTLMCSVCLPSFFPALSAFSRHGSFNLSDICSCLCLIDLFLAEPVLRKDKRALYLPPLLQWHTATC